MGSAPREQAEEIGHRLKIWRAESKLTQADVASQIGVSAQQYQKYEAGVSGIELSRLFDICRVFDKSPSDLVATQSASGDAPGSMTTHDLSEASVAGQADLSFQISELVSHFMAINSQADRNTALYLVKALADRKT